MRLQEAFEAHRDDADFWLIYIREAHASDGPRPARHVDLAQPTTQAERDAAAGGCVADLDLTLPVLVDDLDDTVAKAYEAMPDRLYVLSADGTVAWQGARGPRGFDVDAMVEALQKELEKELAKEAAAAGR